MDNVDGVFTRSCGGVGGMIVRDACGEFASEYRPGASARRFTKSQALSLPVHYIAGSWSTGSVCREWVARRRG